MKKGYLLGIIATFCLLFSCGKSISDLKIGMTAKEVIELVGEPNRTSKPLIGSAGGEMDLNVDEGNVQWTYAGEGHIYFDNGALSKIDKK